MSVCVSCPKEGERDGESAEEVKSSHAMASEKHHSHLPEKPDKAHPILPPKDNKHVSMCVCVTMLGLKLVVRPASGCFCLYPHTYLVLNTRFVL